MRTPFARGYSSPRKYFQTHKGKNYYEQYIRALWNLNKDAKTLKELKTRRIRDSDKSTIPYEKLSPAEKSLSKRANKVAYKIKRGTLLKYAMKEVKMTLEEIKQYLGKSLYKKNGRYYITLNDHRQRQMPFFENGEATMIITRTFKESSLVGTYLNDVRYAIHGRTEDPLKKYEGRYLVDANGKKRYFETNWQKLHDIKERHEELWKEEGRGSHEDDEDF